MEVDRANLTLAFVALGVVIAQQTVILLDLDRGQDDSLPIEGVWIPVIGEQVFVNDEGEILRVPIDHFVVTSMITCERAEGDFFTVSTGKNGTLTYNGVWDGSGYQTYRETFGETGFTTRHAYFFVSENYLAAHYIFYDNFPDHFSTVGILSTYYCRNGHVGDHCEVMDDGTFIVNGREVSFGTKQQIPLELGETWDASRAYQIDNDGYKDLMDNGYTYTYKGSARGISSFVCTFTDGGEGEAEQIVFTGIPIGYNNFVNIGKYGGEVLIDHMDITDEGYICTVSSMYSSRVEMSVHSVAYAPERVTIPFILDAKTLEGKTFIGAATEFAGGEVAQMTVSLAIDSVTADCINGRIRFGPSEDPAEFRLVCVDGRANSYILCNEQALLTTMGTVDVSAQMVLDRSLSRASLYLTGVTQTGLSDVIWVENLEYG